MSEDERQLYETAGDYARVDPDGGTPDWQACRIVLTTERLVLGRDDPLTLPHAKVQVPEAVPAAIDDGETLALGVGETILAIDAGEAGFPDRYYTANLDGTVLLARPRAVVGGVVQDAASFGKAKLSVDDRLQFRFPDRDPLAIRIDAIESVETREESVRGEERAVVVLAHTDGDRRIETHVTGTPRHTSVLRALCATDEDETELSDLEREVLMALYSGVSPFEMAEFLGAEIDEVESVYRALLEKGAVDEIRTRTEVALNATGRNLASEAMNRE